MTPERVSWVPVTLMAGLVKYGVVMVKLPARLLVPPEASSTPPAVVVDPPNETASLPTMTLRSSSVAPDSITVPFAVLPRPLAWATAKVPPEMVVTPL